VAWDNDCGAGGLVPPVDRLLERDTALAELHRCRRAAARGGGRVVLLRGEAGVGKTAVIARFLAGPDQRARVLRGWCDPLTAARPLGPLIDTLASLSDAQAARLRAGIDAGDPEAIYAGLVAMFGDGNAWVWVIEDAHWADGATLDLLRFLSRRIDALPVLLVVSYRDDEIGPTHPLAVLLGDLATCPAVTRIALEPLSSIAVAQLAAGSGVNADALYRLTGGNPFFVTEILAAGPDALGDGGLPRSVSEAVTGRLARLSAPARETVQAAAVCGPRAHPTLLAAVCPDATGALAECIDAGVLLADTDAVRFRHELARRATAEAIPDYQRRVLHKRAVAVLAEPPIDPDTLGVLAFHADQAGDTDAVIRYGPVAAARASALGANRQAAQLYALALRHADTIPDERKVVWHEGHAFTSYLSGQPDAAVASWREAVTLRHQLGDRLEEGDNLRWLSHLVQPLGHGAPRAAAARASLRLLEDLGPSPQLAWSLINMAHIAALALDPACAQYAARAKTLGDELGDPGVVIRARGYAALTTVFCSDTGWNEYEAVWQEAIATRGLEEHAGVLGLLICWWAVLRCELSRADRYLAETAAFCDDHDLGMFRALVAGAEALAGLSHGDWVPAALAADQILTRPELGPQHRIAPLITLALIRARRGEQPVWPPLDEALECAAGSLLRLPVWAARAEAAWLAGDDDTACAEARAGLAEAAEHADPWLVGGHLRRWVRLPGGPPETTVEDPLTPFELEVSGDWRAAVEAWIRRGCPYDAAIAQLDGDIAAVESAVATFRRLGARAAARRAQQRLAHLRGRNPDLRHNDTSADPHGLTKRQRDVLELLAAGHSDTEIATALHISPKTANTHVCAIIAKLGVHNRTQAAAYAHQQPTSPRKI
jgi:DNA-binding CsgD family transcriptional regulator